jgi:hypothetical protein
MAGVYEPWCVVCGAPAVAAHHPAARANLPDVVVGTCAVHHDRFHERLRSAGVRLRHDRQPTWAERFYAVASGLVDVFAEATRPVGVFGDERARVVERLAFGCRRLVLACVRPRRRSFGPNPVRQARRAETAATRGTAPAAAHAEPAEQLRVLYRLIAAGAHALLDAAPEQQAFLHRLDQAVSAVPEAVGRLWELEEVLPPEAWQPAAALLADVAAFAEALTSFAPYSPSPDQAVALRSAATRLLQLEAPVFDFLIGVAAASDSGQALEVLERFFAEARLA